MQGNKQTSRSVATQGVDDLVMLPKVGEAEIVENIHKRYQHDLIYTYIGPVLISVNPYKDLGNAGEQFVPIYHGRFPHENTPHLYALAEEAYRSMKGDGGNQCVLISGESGAGKTEAAKIIMGYISYVSGKSDKVEYVKNVVLDSNPLLEAFGNAKTLRNNNSSRFGKYFEIQFDNYGDPCGGLITNYLLEKSRVVYQQNGERNFHFFYNLCAGANQQEKQKLSLYGAEHYYYINQGNTFTVDGMNDAQDYQEVRHAMNTMGLTAADQESVLRLVSGILNIGNVAFRDQGKNTSVADPQPMQAAAALFGVDPFLLQNSLLFRVINTGGAGGGQKRGSTYNVPQNSEQALGAKDALAREIYSRMFDWIVAKINAALQKYKMPFKNVVGILDIYGFEIFDNNGFEQFCINYVNEKLQQYFIELTLKAEQEEYVKEGIKWTPIKYFNNQIVCELIEGKVGIFGLLDDICYTIHAQSGSGTDLRFLEKLVGSFSQHPHFRGFNNAFCIKHYAGDVNYNVEGMTDKNKDTLFSDVIEMLQTSKSQFLVSLFPEDVKGAQKKRPTTAGLKIKTSAGALMKALSACNPHYVRCIKPNDNKRSGDWNEARVRHQVQYLGLLENVRVRRAGFAYRAPFERFLNRYKKLSKNTWGIWGEWKGGAREGCETICRDLGLENGQYQMGKTKIFIRFPEALFHLEEMVERKDYECAMKIQGAWKKWQLAKHALEQRRRAAEVLRGNKERQRNSVNRNYTSDYMSYDCNFALQQIVQQNGHQESVIFADQVLKLNRRNRPERRDFIVTTQAFYIVARAQQNNEIYYKMTRRAALADISGLSLSPLQDNYLVMHMSREYDNLIENDKKSEIIAVLMEAYEGLTGRKLPVQFSDRITYKIKSGDTRELAFIRNESAQGQPILKKAGRQLKVEISSGLPKETDTTPQGMYLQASTKPRGGGAPRGGGGGAPRGGGAAPAQGGGGAPRGGGGGAPRGGGAGGAAPRGGGAARGGAAPAQGGGAPRGGGGGAPRGAQRGGPRGGAAPRGGRGGGAAGGAPPRPQAKAMFDYDAQTADEITFREGDVLFIVRKDSEDWWEAEMNGKRGYIPANHVEEIK